MPEVWWMVLYDFDTNAVRQRTPVGPAIYGRSGPLKPKTNMSHVAQNQLPGRFRLNLIVILNLANKVRGKFQLTFKHREVLTKAGVIQISADI